MNDEILNNGHNVKCVICAQQLMPISDGCLFDGGDAFSACSAQTKEKKALFDTQRAVSLKCPPKVFYCVQNLSRCKANNVALTGQHGIKFF